MRNKINLGTKNNPVVLDSPEKLEQMLGVLAEAVPTPPWYFRPLDQITDAELAKHGVTRDMFFTITE